MKGESLGAEPRRTFAQRVLPCSVTKRCTVQSTSCRLTAFPSVTINSRRLMGLLPWLRTGLTQPAPELQIIEPLSLSETQTRTYWWCSPPKSGTGITRPALRTARGIGASFCSDRCVRTSL